MRRRLVVALLAAALAVAAAPAARADFGFEPGSVQVTALEAGGQPETQAGAHPDTLTIGFAFTRTPEGELEANARDITVDLPAGAQGDPTATPRCARSQIVLDTCPTETQVGVATIEFAGLEGMTVPIYNVVPEQGVTAEFAMFILLFPVRLDVSVRSESDFGTRVTMSDVLQELPLDAAQITLWGVPADHQTGAPIPRKALLTLPTRCDAPLRTDVRVRTWEQPSTTQTASASIGPLTGCGSLDLSPSTTAPATTGAAPPTAGASGARFTLAGRISPLGGTARKPGLRVAVRRGGVANLRSVALALPRLLALDLGAVATVCGRSAAHAGRCPAATRVGSASLRTPGRPGRMTGPVYALAPGRRGAMPGLWMSLSGGGGARIVLDGATAVRRDGQVTTTFAGLPDLPLSAFELRLRGGTHGLLRIDARRCRLPRAQRTSASVAARSQGGLRASRALATGPWRGCAPGR
jgi:hypothetical protein